MGKKANQAQRAAHPNEAQSQDGANLEGDAQPDALEGFSGETPHKGAVEANAVAEKKSKGKKKDKKSDKKAKKLKKQNQSSAPEVAELEVSEVHETPRAPALAEAAEETTVSSEDSKEVVVAKRRAWRRRFVPSWRRILLVVGVVVIVGAVVLLLLSGRDGGSASAQPAVSDAMTATVEVATIQDIIDGSGAIAGERSVSLAFGTSGTVKSVMVDVGDTVTEGQLLAELDTTDLEYQVAIAEQSLAVQQSTYDELVAGPTDYEVQQARRSLESAQVQLESALANVETQQRQVTISCAGLDDAEEAVATAQEAYDDYLAANYALDATFLPDADTDASKALSDAQSAYDVSLSQCENARASAEDSSSTSSAQANVDKAQADLDELLKGPSETEITKAEAQLEQARIQLEQAREALAEAQIFAPFDGIVTSVGMTEGFKATSGEGSAIVLVDVSQLHMDVLVDELDIAKVQVGQPARVTLESAEDTTLAGEVARVDPVGEESSGIVTYTVRVNVTPDDVTPILLGMTADVEIVVAIEENVMTVPTEAIQQLPNGNEMVLVQDDAGQVMPVVVVSGQTTDGRTVVTGELQEGQTVVIPALQTDEQTTDNAGASAGGFFGMPGGMPGGGMPSGGPPAGGAPGGGGGQ